MATDDPTERPAPSARSAETERREAERRVRMAAALRENLKKRKAQTRAKTVRDGAEGGSEG